MLVTATREGVLQAILNLETNDPLRPTVSIPVTRAACWAAAPRW